MSCVGLMKYRQCGALYNNCIIMTKASGHRHLRLGTENVVKTSEVLSALRMVIK